MKKTKKQLNEEIDRLKTKDQQHQEAETNSKTWYLSGNYNPAFPGGGERHPLEYD